ncbi:FMN-dependent NADH-azoreductase [Bacillus sp. MUM 116]|uniref:FMN-dependent NADH-azoreductase n=1 Tax=Bacillus sp. MUM 116 TaxID=1678002 RepID=UPI0008F5614C|nr:FMN-dependent NADH-azoreductase [Bacillus sp. MUM 116]OIK12991.1 FMN-dependent NADH-azoreductase [Bacillus sp. MUM 116]
MSKVLFIKANNRPTDQAVSSKMYEAFLNTYKEANPTDETMELDLFKAELPNYGNTAIMGVFKSKQGLELTTEETKAADLVDHYLDQFFAADKIVFAFPLWNSMVPAPLVNYISYLAQAGKTFKYTPEGPIGLAGDKKVVLLSARGGDYSSEAMAAFEMAVRYVQTNLGLWGITNPETIVIEGHNQYSDRAEEIIADGLEKVAKASAKF